MIHLRKLRAQLLQYKVEDVEPNVWIEGHLYPDGKRTTMPHVDKLDEAHGISFLCPLCYLKRKEIQYGVHRVICWFEGRVPDEAAPSPGRWTPSGTGIDDLTFVQGHRVKLISVLLLGEGCGWHGYVVNGRAG